MSTIVGQLYPQGDPRRDSGFSIFYMGINPGAVPSPLVCGWLGETIGLRLGFGLAGVGMIAGLIQYLLGGKYLGSVGLHPAPAASPEAGQRLKRNAGRWGHWPRSWFWARCWRAPRPAASDTAERISAALGMVLIIVSLAIFAWLLFGPGWSVTERKRSAAILVLFVASATFWAAYEQAGSSLSLFAERSTNRVVFGFDFPASWFQFVPSLFVMILALVFAWLWIALRKREPSSPAKFAWALVFGAIAFAILVPPARAAVTGALVSPWWLTGTYFIQTVGEMCLSPVGLSAMTKLAPARVAGMMMGLFFVSISIGDYLAGTAASLYESMPLPTLFGTVAVISLGAALLLALLVKPTKKLMGGVN